MNGAYPLPRPGEGEDPRFTFGLVLDVAQVLAGHGYPDLTDGAVRRPGDWAALQTALFSFIYAPPGGEPS